MIKFSSNQIRSKWLSYFENNDHYVLESKSLIPENDNSLLWINSGVATLKPYFSGTLNPPKNRLTNSQKAIRTNDITNVGVTSRHHTFFEMLGNFSIADYFKKQAIDFAYDLFVNEFKLPLNKLYFTVYNEDKETHNFWVAKGIEKTHIILGNKDRNFWDLGEGPCGPCTEIFIDRGEKYDPNNKGIELFSMDLENDRYVELWNIVFSEFNNMGNGEYKVLTRKNIDTGAGLERLACVLQDVPTNYDTDLFQPIINTISKFGDNLQYEINAYFSSNKEQIKINRNLIIIADHLKANVFAIADGAIPSNKERGAILRRLLRRAFVAAYNLKINPEFLTETIKSIIKTMEDYYPYLNNRVNEIIKVIKYEQSLFAQTFHQGMILFKKAIEKQSLDSQTAFRLSETYGFPVEIIKSMCLENNIHLDVDGFNKLFKQHQNISRVRTGEQKSMSFQNDGLINFTDPSTFLYKETNSNDAKIIQLFDLEFNKIQTLNKDGWIVFDKTPFYATSGGQVCDKGYILTPKRIEVIDVIKGPNLQHFHKVSLNEASVLSVGMVCNLSVDQDTRIKITRNHSSEHLLQKAIQDTISTSIHQEGALKTKDKLTFDFSYTTKPTPKQIFDIESKVNDYINSKTEVVTNLMTLEDAKKNNAQAHFTNVYTKLGEKLRVVQMGNISIELCGGTHVENLSEIEEFMITSLTTKGSGLYRIEAITSFSSIIEYIKNKYLEIKKTINEIEKLNSKTLNSLIYQLSFDLDKASFRKIKEEMSKIIELYNQEIKKCDLDSEKDTILFLKKSFNICSNSTISYIVLENQKNKPLLQAMTSLQNENQNHIFIAINIVGTKIQYIVACGIKTTQNARDIVDKFNHLSTGFGGGSEKLAQGGTNDLNKKQTIIDYINKINLKY